MQKQTTGQRIAFIRKQRQWTQDDLAQRLNISNKTISKWERDEGMPDVSLLVPLANVLGISVDDLLGSASDTEPSNKSSINYALISLIIAGAILIIYALPSFVTRLNSLSDLMNTFNFDFDEMTLLPNIEVISPYDLIFNLFSGYPSQSGIIIGILQAIHLLTNIGIIIVHSLLMNRLKTNRRWAGFGFSLSLVLVLLTLAISIGVRMSGLQTTLYHLLMWFAVITLSFTSYKVFQLHRFNSQTNT